MKPYTTEEEKKIARELVKSLKKPIQEIADKLSLPDDSSCELSIVGKTPKQLVFTLTFNIQDADFNVQTFDPELTNPNPTTNGLKKRY